MTLLAELARALPDGTFADVHESDDAYLVVLDAPGVTGESLEVEGRPGSVRLRATAEPSVPADYEPVRTERSAGLDATLPFPPDAETGAASASVERGVVTVTVPRTDRRTGPEDGGTD